MESLQKCTNLVVGRDQNFGGRFVTDIARFGRSLSHGSEVKNILKGQSHCDNLRTVFQPGKDPSPFRSRREFVRYAEL
jgi:hypothetical protein